MWSIRGPKIAILHALILLTAFVLSSNVVRASEEKPFNLSPPGEISDSPSSSPAVEPNVSPSSPEGKADQPNVENENPPGQIGHADAGSNVTSRGIAHCNWKAHFDKTVGQGTPFLMVTLGDSVIWGQGHPLGTDFASLVQQWIQSQSGGAVRKLVYAHSGATIDDTAEAYKEVFGGGLHGEINWSTPTINQQVDCIPQEIGANTDFVLMDGCINDFSAMRILDPTVDRQWIRKETYNACNRMRPLLQKVVRKFPKATVVVTGYFPIVSAESDPSEVAKLLSVFGPLGVGSFSITGLTMRNKLGANSAEWYQASNEILRQIVNETNVAENGRIAFAPVPFGPGNAFGAPQTYLYRFPDDIVSVNQDPVFGGRRRACMEFYGGSVGGLIKCIKASAFHPNDRGVAVYRNTIISALQATGALAKALPDGSLIKGTTTPEVYVLQGGIRRWIISQPVFDAMGFVSSRIKTFPDQVVASIPRGPDIADPRTAIARPPTAQGQAEAAAATAVAKAREIEAQVARSLPDGTLLKGSAPEVYLIQGRQRRWIVSMDVFNAMGFQSYNIRTMSDSAVASIPRGPDLSDTKTPITRLPPTAADRMRK